MHYLTFFISTPCVGIELEGGYFVECIADGRDAHLGQLVGEGQRDGCLVVSRARAAQQIARLWLWSPRSRVPSVAGYQALTVRLGVVFVQ